MSWKFSPETLKLDASKAEASTRKWIKTINGKKANNLDSEAQRLHNEAFDHIDCLACANCCKTISPIVTDKDIERLAKYLKIKPSAIIDQYLQIDEDGDYVFRQTPCPFLGPDNYCAVYESRPKACREYPHTNRARFYQLLNLTLKNTFVCPAAFQVMEGLKKNIK